MGDMKYPIDRMVEAAVKTSVELALDTDDKVVQLAVCHTSDALFALMQSGKIWLYVDGNQPTWSPFETPPTK